MPVLSTLSRLFSPSMVAYRLSFDFLFQSWLLTWWNVFDIKLQFQLFWVSLNPIYLLSEEASYFPSLQKTVCCSIALKYEYACSRHTKNPFSLHSWATHFPADSVSDRRRFDSSFLSRSWVGGLWMSSSKFTPSVNQTGGSTYNKF